MQGSAAARAKSNSSAVPGTYGIPNYNEITMPVFNDPWMDSQRLMMASSVPQQEEMMNPSPSPNLKKLPSVEEMTNQVLYHENPYPSDTDEFEHGSAFPFRTPKGITNLEEKKENGDDLMDSYAWYEYDDYHPSNANRFFLLNGVASSVNGRGPLLLGEVAAAGLCQLQAKSRRQAQEEVMQSPLFEQFVGAVRNKGFFEDPEHATPKSDPREEEERLVLQKAVHDERMAKVVCKFRNKLAAKVDLQGEGGGFMMQMLDFHHSRRINRVIHSRKLKSLGLGIMKPSLTIPHLVKASSMHMRKFDPSNELSPMARTAAAAAETLALEQQAEKLKSQGNAHMQKKDYEAAMECYTQALRLSPSGPQSHVYFSNRAAALLSMKRFDQAILDSERALALQPTYGKAHARLGLAHFLLGDYRHAMEAYTVALKYEPDNKSSKSYLEKSAKKLAQMQLEEGNGDVTHHTSTPTVSSFSVVSEWDKTNKEVFAKGGGPPRRDNGNSATSNSSKLSNGNSTMVKNANQLPTTPGKGSDAAENQKTQGNAHMANREYELALECYSTAIEMSPNGPQSHVYYSNRAAALCYLERYEQAAEDSEMALQLKPSYGKAHARLGLSRFFLHDYEGAVQAYTTALKYDPDNAASKSYLVKAKAKLEQQQQQTSGDITPDARRLMDDPDMMLMAKKVMQHNGGNGTELLLDPEMQKITRRALSDPTMMDALKSIPRTMSPA